MITTRTSRLPGFLVVALFIVGASANTSHAREVTIDPAGFGPVIDNPYWPLVPGTTFVYEVEEDGVLVLGELTVTCDTKVIEGVTTTVVFDREWVDGVLAESTFDWFAQDLGGNIWYFGEDTKELDEDGNVISTAGSWEAGVDGARAGIIMLADPRPGLSYQQEFAAGIAEDRAKILRVDMPVSTALGDFTGCLRIKEWTRLSPGAIEHKYYAPGTGLIRIDHVSGGRTRVVELTDIRFDNCD